MKYQEWDLSGRWHMTDLDGGNECSVELPGDSHTALLVAGIIPDPYWGLNELEIQWAGRRDWRFEREISLDIPSGADGLWTLRLESVDTIAEIQVNGTTVATSNNMFVPVLADVTPAVQNGSNTITIIVRSAEVEAASRAERLTYPVPHSEYPVQSPHRNLVRKVQCHAGWDWGPALMVAGVYGAMILEYTPNVRIDRAYGIPVPAEVPNREPDYSVWTWEMTLEVTAAREQTIALSWDVDGVGAVRQDVAVTAGTQTIVLSRQIESPKLWWPAGYGEQSLYHWEISCGDARVEGNTGFRHVQLVTKADDAGQSMFFRVNGRDIWAKGANWIPTDAFPSRQTDDRYRELLEASVAANMNMLRAWGGGQYERRSFYELCDQLGIMVWQDFMFSCSMYPSAQWFLEEVEPEVRAQVKRLLSHPSLAIWCGNNENIGALGWFEVTRKNPGRYLIDFDRLNNGVVGKTVKEVDRSRVFWPSSPAAGEGDFSDNWHDDTKGDMHYWSVWHEGLSFDGYYQVTPRFCSEFGFQSFPSIHGVAAYAPPTEWNPTSPVMEHHQRHPRGNTVIAETMTRYFRIPYDFGDFLYLSQVQQALAIRTAVDFWRSQRPTAMGALYWQLNDLWPVASWSSIEYDGRWKLLHYEARRFFAPLAIVAYVKDGHVQVWCLNDTAEEVGGTVAIELRRPDGSVATSSDVPVSVHPDSAIAAWTVPLAELPDRPERLFLTANWTSDRGHGTVAGRTGSEGDGGAGHAGAPGTDSGTIASTWIFLTEPKRYTLPDASARVEIVESSPEVWDVAVTAEKGPLFYIVVESADPDVHLEDNMVLILPGETRTFRARREIKPSAREALKAGRSDDRPVAAATGTPEFRIRHLRGTY